ncbi:MAG: rhomboid family intramembrane serine protease [Bacteroidota bacterium]|nr:rhomboid family intramembrane serine protease [Bacteroidota bacterium]
MSDFRSYRPNNFPPVVKYLIIINAIVFAAQNIFDNSIGLTEKFALWPVNSPFFRPYQIITHMFSHGSIGHIFFNMFALWMFGKILENVWGGKRFLNFYLICGIGAAVVHLTVEYFTGNYGAAIGASGAIMGVLVAFGYLFPNTELFILFIPFPIKAKWAVIGYIAIDLFSGVASFSGDNVAHFAHLGGALTGFILVLLWNKSNRRFY